MTKVHEIHPEGGEIQEIRQIGSRFYLKKVTDMIMLFLEFLL